MPQTPTEIPRRSFGSHREDQISILGLGGHHLGQAADAKTAALIVNRAIDAGINFFDNCWEYHIGRSEDWMGRALKPRRKSVFLMSKVCTHGRDKNLALHMLEQSLRRLQTDHLDLWQIHGVSFDNDPELFIRPNGAAEALRLAKQQGKVRYVGFTGHKDPQMHLKMLATGFPFDAVQMPLNTLDSTFRSFETQVLPELNRRGIASLGMKSLGGTGDVIKKGVVTAAEALRYAMSLPVTTTITGMERMEVLEQNLALAAGFVAMPAAEMQALRQRVRKVAADGRFELYKVSLKYDNPEARLSHNFPLDMQSMEVQEMTNSQNTGEPFPAVQSTMSKRND